MTTDPGLSGPGAAFRGAVSRTAAAMRAPATAPRLTARIFDAFHRLRLAEAGVIAAEARLLLRLFDRGGHRKLGFARLGDLARERLGVSPRHADDRLALARTFANRPNVERAFREGRITACQVLALRNVFDDGTEEMWLALCPGMTVREIRQRVREMKEAERSPAGEEDRASAAALAAAEPDGDADAPLASIAFPAPPAAVVAWDQAMETARRVIGANVPQYRCVEAILAEVAPHLAPEEGDGVSAGGPRTFANGVAGPDADADVDPEIDPDASPQTFANGSPRPDDTIISLKARRLIAMTLDQIDRELQDIESLTETEGSEDPSRIVQRIRALQQVSRPLRILTGRLLDRIHGVLNAADTVSLAGFAERHLRVSETTARGLLDETRIFEDPVLARAFVAGRIGIGQAVRIDRIASRDRIDAWIDRAAGVTHRQFQRETWLIERLQEFFPGFAFRTPGPFPEAALENRLRQALRERGWTDREIEVALKAERVGAFTAASDSDTADPAENPALMRRLEILLEQLILTAFPTEAVLPSAPRTFANDGVPGRIRFRAPAFIKLWWQAALHDLQAERGPLPAWACAMLFIRAATTEWEAGHTPPSEHAILERDRYLCQAPGCSRRRNLQIHHIRFRSRGGADSMDNKITLCFVHHQILLHEMKSVSVAGTAPGKLTWTLGGTWHLKGEKWHSG